MSNASGSTGWIRDGALWTYNKPPTRAERQQETIRTNKEIRDGWLEKHPELEQCPECGSGNYGTTLLGGLKSVDHYHDPNWRTCECGHRWRAICPTCGEEGRL